MTNKIVHIVGGSTCFHLDAHLALTATGMDGRPAKGGTAKRIARLCEARDENMQVCLHLTTAADQASTIDTNEDLKSLALAIVDDPSSKIVFWNPAVVDFSGALEETGKDSGRIRTTTHEGEDVGPLTLTLLPSQKLIGLLRQGSEGREPRKDIFLVGFKATAGAPPDEQYRQGLDLLKRTSANLVLVNDTVNKFNMVVVPEEGAYHATYDREDALRGLVEMAYLRSKLTFTRSTVVPGNTIAWNSEVIPSSLRTVVDHCIARGAYKRVRGVTAGHFAVKLNDQTFLTSRRKTDFNDMKNVGLVKVTTDGPDSVVAYGSKPSVGGQSQRIVFSEHAGMDSIVHFHCPPKPASKVPVVSQREYECGSHECGQNTSAGLQDFDGIKAVYLKDHGFNIVFNSKTTNPETVIAFIDRNCELSQKTGGYALT